MSIDLSQFHQVFFEESFEGLDVMESQLLDLQPESVDAETVNTIFRAAHSIKGGAGTFGFMQVSEFTHVVETLLDEIRSGTRVMVREYVDLFLQSVDCLRAMLSHLQSGQEPDKERPASLKKQFEAILRGEMAATDASDAKADVSTAEPVASGWKITFRPQQDLLQTGNEPFRMFRELQELVGEGNFTAHPNTDELPDLSNLSPELCYLSWDIEVRGAIDKSSVMAVFEWVADECEITCEPLGAESASSADSAESSVVAEKAAAPEHAATTEKAATTETASAGPVIPEAVTAAVTAANLAAGSAAQAATTAAAAKSPKSNEPSSIRVSIDKVDSLINMVGELVITQSMLGQLGQDFDISRLSRLQEGLAQLEQNTRELQESVMKIRMMPISFAFSRFPRLVRDLGGQLGKQVNLIMLGENTELDKTVMEKIGDPLVHLVRNSMDHGLETTDKRIAAGKKAEGNITLNAYHQGGNIVIEVSDDGAGLNEEKILSKAKQKKLVPENAELSPEDIHQLIFLPGFSTADVVSDISGRGVGMDVVRRNINELNGTIEVKSTRGKGSTFVIRLPLTLAILDGQLVKVRDQTYIFPLVSIVESIQLQKRSLNNITGSQHVMKLREEYIPIVRLDEMFGLRPEEEEFENPMLVVVEGDTEKIGIVVDDLLGQQQVVIKSLEQNYQKVAGISGATILGDGTVALIIDISGVGKAMDLMPDHKRPERAA
ncbi:chemotaxis protein CheA [Thalassolituus sp. LLYu03]|uniref:chemotaxis protein CheA n=1 Tax=Thalassolituus sp. LLYu03 TaxID=3421656 RepID=UPI003D2748AA